MQNNFEIGVQLFTLRNEVAENGVYKTLEKVKEIGFTSVEQSAFPLNSKNVEELEKAKNDFDIKINAVSANLQPLEENAEGEFVTRDKKRIAEICKRLECPYVRIGAMPLNFMKNETTLAEFIKIADNAAAEFAEEGIKLYYHNHHFEFFKMGGKYALDIIFENTKHIGFELDTHWIHRGGEMPLYYIGKFENRMDIFHLKDHRIKVAEKEDGLVTDVEFAEVGEGSLPMKAIIDKAAGCGSKYFFIEQDDTYGVPPFESLAISRKNLMAMGFAVE